jgi:hypothetical protein
LRVAPVSVTEWIVPFALASILLIVMEAFKIVMHGRSTVWPSALGAGRSDRA